MRIQVQRNRCYLIQEITVVADDDQGALVIDQIIFQPSNGFDIQVVGRLVQDQKFWFFQQHFGKG